MSTNDPKRADTGRADTERADTERGTLRDGTASLKPKFLVFGRDATSQQVFDALSRAAAEQKARNDDQP